MDIILPETTKAIKNRGKKISKSKFKYTFDYSEVTGRDIYDVVTVNVQVVGTSLYNLQFEIHFAGEGLETFFEEVSCDCPHDVYVCKHLYGAMYHLAQDTKKITEIEDEIYTHINANNPKAEWGDDESIDHYDSYFTDEEHEPGMSVSNAIKTLEEIGIIYQGNPSVYKAQVTSVLGTDESISQEVIERIVDEIMEEIETRDEPKMKATYETIHIMNSMLETSISKIAPIKYEFVPELVIDRMQFGLKLKVSVKGGKSFVIKNIYDLPMKFTYSEEEEFGSNTVIKFNYDQFDNKPLVDFLLKEIEKGTTLLDIVSAKGHRDWYGYYSAGKVDYDKKELKLTHNSLLEFLKLSNNQSIKLKYNELRSRNYNIVNEKEVIDFSVDEYEDYVQVSQNDDCRFIACNDFILKIDFSQYQLKLIDVELQENAKNIEALVENVHVIDGKIAFSFEEIIVNKLKEFINIKYDFSKLYGDTVVCGFKTHINLQKNILTIAPEINIPDDIGEEAFYINEPKRAILNAFLAKYEQPEYEFPETIQPIQIEEINQIIDFVTGDLNVVEDISEVLTSNEEFKNFKIIKKVPISTTTSRIKGKTILKFESSQFKDNELIEVLKAFDNDTKYLQLDSGAVVDLSSQEVKKVIETANKLDLDINKATGPEFEVDLASIFYYNKIFDALQIENKDDEHIQNIISDYNGLEEKTYRKPKQLEAKLRKYQKLGVKWIDFLQTYDFGGILADDMGLGKTLQVISHLAKQKSKLPTLIITPASLVYNWKYEFEKFTTNPKVLVLDGSVKERGELITQIEDHNCLISYSTFKRDFEKLSELKFNYVILDEAQHIKNNNTKVAKAVKAIDSEHRLALTGTPIENNLNDLWSLFDFIMPGYLGTNKEFKKKYINPIENGNDQVQERLKQKVSPFIMRRLKGDVLTELPAKNEKIIHIKMDESQQKLYDVQANLVKDFLNANSDDEIKSKQIEILAMITKLRQIACNPKLVNAKYTGDIAKQDYLIEHLQTLTKNKHKTVIFSQFVSNFEYIEKQLKKEDIEYYKITGQTEKQKRFDLVSEFNNNDVPVFLISLKAGGTGLNIVGADTVIHYDPWWNTAVESQATDRVHRMGQKSIVFVYKLICEKTIEEQIVKLQEEKRKLAENLLESDGIKSSTLTKDDIFGLF